MAAPSPVVSPVVSDDDLEFGLLDFLASQQDNSPTDNCKGLWQEGQDADDRDADPKPENFFVDPEVLSINNTDQDENVWDQRDWDGDHRPLAVCMWGDFKFKHGFERAFQPLRGTHAARYIKAVEQREKSLEETKELCQAVARAGEGQEQPREDRRFVAEGLQEIHRYEQFRAACPSKHEIETLVTTARVHGQEVEVKWILLDSEPFLGYLPGDYLVRHVVESDGQEHLVIDGIVPYTQEEYINRLECDVVPDVLDMIIAFVVFNPLDVNSMPQWCADLRNKSVSALTANDIEKVHCLWEHKFMDFQTLPSVLELQCSDSESKLCEAAWLLEEVEKLGVVYPWSEGLKQLLQEATGQFVHVLGRRYTDKVLRREASECIEDDEFDRVLVYQMSSFAWKTDIFDFYRGHGASINEHAPSPQRLADIRHAAENALPPKSTLPPLRFVTEETVRFWDPECNPEIAVYTQDFAQHSSDTHDDAPSDNNLRDSGQVAAHSELHSSARVSFGETTLPVTKKVVLQLPAQSGSTSDTIVVVPSAEPAAIVSSPTSKKRKRAGTTTEAPSSLPEADPASSSSLEAPSPPEQPAPEKRGPGRPRKKAGDPKSPYRRKKPVSQRAPSRRQRLEKEKAAKDRS